MNSKTKENKSVQFV